MVYDFPAPVCPYAKTVPLYPFKMSSTVDLMEKSKTSLCRELVSKTWSKVNAPEASADWGAVSMDGCHGRWRVARGVDVVD